jgi:hypothetical protein
LLTAADLLGVRQEARTVADPPWYAADTQSFLWAAARITAPGAAVLLAQPALATRPGVLAERASIWALPPGFTPGWAGPSRACRGGDGPQALARGNVAAIISGLLPRRTHSLRATSRRNTYVECSWRLARYRSPIPLLAFTPEPATRSQLSLSWGVETFIVPPVSHTESATPSPPESGSPA